MWDQTKSFIHIPYYVPVLLLFASYGAVAKAKREIKQFAKRKEPLNLWTIRRSINTLFRPLLFFLVCNRSSATITFLFQPFDSLPRRHSPGQQSFSRFVNFFEFDFWFSLGFVLGWKDSQHTPTQKLRNCYCRWEKCVCGWWSFRQNYILPVFLISLSLIPHRLINYTHGRKKLFSMGHFHASSLTPPSSPPQFPGSHQADIP